MATAEISRNAPCPCGSGRKYKHCCIGGPIATSRTKLRLLFLLAVAIIVAGAWWAAYWWGLRVGGIIAIAGLATLVGYVILRNPPPSRGRTGADRIDFGR